MKLSLFKPLWGHEGSYLAAVKQAVDAKFDGIEGTAPTDSEEHSQFGEALREATLQYIGEVFTGGDYVPNPHATPQEHLDDLRFGIERSLPLNPVFINTQAGLDAWPMSRQVPFFESILDLESEYNIPITIETHRSRSTFNPWITQELIEVLPELRLNLDFSHWCAVAERLVMDDDPMQLLHFAGQCHHLHGRVGYAQGPQVPDPRAPEYKSEVESHLHWWTTVWESMASRGYRSITMTPEFGTDGYLHLMPYTKKPVADLWSVNCWMAETLRERFESFSICMTAKK